MLLCYELFSMTLQCFSYSWESMDNFIDFWDSHSLETAENMLLTWNWVRKFLCMYQYTYVHFHCCFSVLYYVSCSFNRPRVSWSDKNAPFLPTWGESRYLKAVEHLLQAWNHHTNAFTHTNTLIWNVHTHSHTIKCW